MKAFKTTAQIETEAMRERSGNITVDSRLVSFLYTLMRDTVSPGEIERIVRDCKDSDVTYTNGWLALYAKDIADRLK